jgi:serine/threonine protein kinase
MSVGSPTLILLPKVFHKAEPNAIDLISRLLEYTPTQRLSAIEAMAHPFFDELRNPETRLPDSRNQNGGTKELPNLFDFSLQELSTRPDLSQQLVPPHARAALRAKGLDIDSVNFKPMDKDDPTSRAEEKGSEEVVRLLVRQEDVKADLKDSDSQLGDRIRATIQSHTDPKHGLYHIRCQASWQILVFCCQQLDGQYERLRQVITLTGTPTHAQAASCEDFAHAMWPSQGLKLLDALVLLLENESCGKVVKSVQCTEVN